MIGLDPAATPEHGKGARIGLNLLYMLPGIVGGTETYAAGLIEGLVRLAGSELYTVYLNSEAADWPLPVDSRIRRVVCPVRARSRLARYWFEQRELPNWVERHELHLLHSLGYIAPLRLRCFSVLTVPDVHYLAYGRITTLPRRLLLRWMVRESVRRASAVIAISKYSGAAVARECGLSVNDIETIPLAAKSREKPLGQTSVSLPRRDTKRPYLVAFGGVQPNKNIPRLVAAFHRARTKYAVHHDLVIVGRLPPKQNLSANERVIATGYLDDARLMEVVSRADALVFPSIYEGFGLPILEAMAAGVPVICSQAAAIPEVAGNAARYFDPLDVEEIALRIAEIAHDAGLRAQMRLNGIVRARQFSWEATARQTLAVYRRVLAVGGCMREQV